LLTDWPAVRGAAALDFACGDAMRLSSTFIPAARLPGPALQEDLLQALSNEGPLFF